RTPVTGFHWGASQRISIAAGNASRAAEFSNATRAEGRLFVSAVLVDALPNGRTVVALGDSITDGNGSTPDADRRWPDFLARRLAPHGIAVANAGISGARLLKDGMGEGALARFGQDVLGQPGVSDVIVLLGINDIGKDIPDAVIADNYFKIIKRVHAQSPQTNIYIQSVLPIDATHTHFPQHYDKGQHVPVINNLLKAKAKELNFTWVDIAPLFTDKRGLLDSRYTLEGLHLNADAYKVWVAYLKKNVKLTDGRATLVTEDLEYNLATGIATYKNGGKVVNGPTVLTSSDAVYYSDTKDVYFKKYVHLTDPQYDIKADSLLYNTQFKVATFISPTRIVTKEGGVINTKSGTYNLEKREAIFYDRTAYSDSTRSLTGGKIAYDEKSGILQVEENGKLVDSVNNVTVVGGQILVNKLTGSFLASRKPVMILYRNNDSTYIAADTLFSGLRKYDSAQDKTVLSNDTINNVMKVDVAAKSDSIRYFIAFNHTRIFNDSLQAVCDSLYYSTEDSVFRMFRDPVFWNDKTQVTGDTMYLFTEKQQPTRM
ncbi:MAG: hypothetical protein EOO39_28760, partial [Cytophagaceae bacterium]